MTWTDEDIAHTHTITALVAGACMAGLVIILVLVVTF